jgi:UDP-N-acetylglucosamine 2-epimerase (non-hydrolysing)
VELYLKYRPVSELNLEHKFASSIIDSMGKRVLLVVGARPNLMKAAALILAISSHDFFVTRLVHTGQHYDENMSKLFFQDLGLHQPDINLGIGIGSPTQQIARTMLALEKDVINWQPDLMVVFGDVNSTLAGALVANRLSIPLAHVEAGLRSFDRKMPEEYNRIITDQLSDYLFTSTIDAEQNLIREGIPTERISFVGNVMVDTLLRFRDQAHQNSAWSKYGLHPKTYALVTLHRPSNVDEQASLDKIAGLLESLQMHLPVLFPIHPRTCDRLEEFGLSRKITSLPGLIITPPLGYLEFVSLLTEACLVLTTSGGIQEETTVLEIPCLTMRANTERPITIVEGTNRLVGTDRQNILVAVDEILNSPPPTNNRIPKYWDGRAAQRIVEILEH